jgi:hypothetical protein
MKTIPRISIRLNVLSSIPPSRSRTSHEHPHSSNVMYLRQLLRKPRALPLSKLSTRPHRSSRLFRRFESTDTKTSARANRVLDRVPKFLRRYTDVLRNAPVSHIVAFLILHEITAIVPLVGLAGYFHYANWLPPVSLDLGVTLYLCMSSHQPLKHIWNRH